MRYQNDVIHAFLLLRIRISVWCWSCHAARRTPVMLEANNMLTFRWSSKSLHLNPIDDLLDLLKSKVRAQSLQLYLRELARVPMIKLQWSLLFMLGISCIKLIFGYLYFSPNTFPKIKLKLGDRIRLSVWLNKILIYIRKWFWLFVSSQTRWKHHKYQAIMYVIWLQWRQTIFGGWENLTRGDHKDYIF